ncbi:MAG: carbon-nitrogen family hydrolase [Chloroflexi bacterium]|nr:carbon-nitrogen family hydrolase [Chloroflexota bacterium]
MNPLTIALAQMDLALGEPARNLEAARAQVAEAKSRGADLVLLPELWSTAYDLEHATQHATALGDGMFAEMARAAREFGIAVAGSLLEAAGGRVYNTAVLMDAEGQQVGAYRKLHLVPMLDEDRYLTGGDSAPTFDAAFGQCALAVCYDLRFPELWRHYALSGARLILLPAEWPSPRIAHWRALLPARAIENQFFIAATNRVGSSKDQTFGGHSTIVNPWGEALVEGDERAGLLIAQIDLDMVDEVRRRVPVFRDRRVEVYIKWDADARGQARNK